MKRPPPQPLLTVVVPTIGRATLPRALRSIREQVGPETVELLCVGDTHGDEFRLALAAVPGLCAEFAARYVAHDGGQHCVGQPQRQRGMAEARGRWVMWGQDDSRWLPGAWAAIRASLRTHPHGPRLFRVQTQWGFIVWQQRALAEGNCDADGICVPKDPARLGAWGRRYEGDWDFLRTTVALWDGALHYETALIAEATPIAARRPA